MQILSNLSLYGTLGLNSVADANTDTDKFLVIDSSGIVKYRTGAELYNDIGAGGAAAYTSTLQHEVKAAVALTKGQAVYVTSADGTNMIVSKASNASEGTSSKTLGLIAQDLSINGKGYVITEGLLSGLNTMAAGTEGDPVWLGTDGNLIYGLGAKPYAPDHLVFIGIVTRKNANNGEIFVKVQNGFELQELHNVQITSTPSDNAVLAYETSTSLYKMKSIPTLLGYTPTTNARNITINGTTYDLSADRSWSVGTHTGSLTTGYVPKATGATTLTDSLIYDNGSGIGINTTSPYDSANFKLDVNGGVLIKSTSGTLAQLILINSNPATGGNNGFVQFTAGGNTATAFAELQSYYGISIASGALRLQPAGGQVLIGTRTTSAYTTDINGTLRVSGQLTLGSTISNNTYVYTMPGASGTIALVSDIPSSNDYVPSSRTLTINGTSYDLSANRSWTIAAGVSSVQAGSGISVSTTSGVATVVNTGLLSGTAGSGISVSTSGQNLNIVNTGLLSGTAGAGISVSTTSQNLNIVNTGLLSATAGSGISVSTTSQNVNIVNTGLLSATAGTGISVSTTSGTLNIVNTITNTNQLTNGAGYITSITSGMVTTALGYTPYNATNPNGYITGYTETDTLASVTARGATTTSPITINGGGTQPLSLTTNSGSPWHIALNRTDLGLTSRVYAHNSPYNGWYFEHNIIIAGNTNIHSGNYNSYAPTLTGGGASGTWGINVTGTAGSETLATVTGRGNTTTSSMAIGSGSIPNGRLYVNSGSGSDVVALQNSLNTGAYLVFADNVTPTWANAPRLGAISNDMVFKTLNTERFIISSTGASTFSGKLTTGLLIAQGPGGNYNENVRLPGSTAVISFNTSGDTGAGSYNIVSQTNFQIRNAGGTQVFIMDQSGNLTMSGNVSGNYILGTYFNASLGNSENPTIGQIWTQSTGDNYLRKSTPAHFISQLGLITSSNIGSQSVNYANSSGSVSGLTLNSISSPINPDSVTQNQLGYNTSVNLFGQTDGGLYSSAYNVNWIHQIYGDFRSGQIAIRGKQSGTWQAWRVVLDSSNYTSYAPSLTGSGASGTWGINVTGNATYSLNSTRLYASDAPYTYGGSAPYYMFMTYDGSRWLLQVSPATPSAVRVSYADSAGSASSASTSSQVTINYNDNSNANYQLLWGSGNSVYGTGSVYVNPSSDTIYAVSYRGSGNVGGTGEATHHPAGIYSQGTQWLYGTTYRNNATTSGQGQMYFDGNFGYGMVGLYASTRYQAIFAMGDAYKLPVDGTSTGSLYGLAWSHPNAGGVAGNLNTHGLLVMENGAFLAAVSGSIRARDDMRAPIFYDSNDTGYYADFNSTSQSAIRVRGGALHGPNPTWGKYLLVGGDGRQGYIDNADVASVSTTNGNLHLDAASGLGIYFNFYDGSEIYFGRGNTSSISAFVNSSGNWNFGNSNSASYLIHARGDIYADGGWLRVSGTSGLYFETYGGGWHMTDTSYVKIYNGKSVNMLGNSVDYVGSIYMNGGVYIQTNNNRNLQILSGGAADNGIYGRGNGGQFCYQLYGDGANSYGFLNGVWAGWDFRKTIGGALYMNGNNDYYLATNGTSKLNTLNVNNLNTGNTINIGYTNNNESVATSDFRGLEFHNPGNRDYYIGKDSGAWTKPLAIHFYTGIEIRSHQAYGGTRFHNIASGQVGSFNDGDNNFRGYYDIIAYASDRRLKENVKVIDNAIGKVKQLTGMTYNWNSLGNQYGWSPSSEREAGVFAQDVQAVLPEAVKLAPFDNNMGVSKSGENFLTVKYEKIVPLLIEAIKEQQQQIEDLKSKLDAVTK